MFQIQSTTQLHEKLQNTCRKQEEELEQLRDHLASRDTTIAQLHDDMATREQACQQQQEALDKKITEIQELNQKTGECSLHPSYY